MATFVQATGGFVGTAGTSFGQAYGAAVKAGSLLVCVADSSTPGGTQSVSDSLNGAWTAVPNSLGNDGSRTSQTFYVFAGSAGTPTVTLSHPSSSNYRALMVAEYAEIYGVDAGALGTGTSAAPTVVVPVNVVDDVVTAGTFGVNTVTPPAGVNDRVNDNGDHFVDLIGPALGSRTIAFSMTSGGWATTGASFTALSQMFHPHRMPMGA